MNDAIKALFEAACPGSSFVINEVAGGAYSVQQVDGEAVVKFTTVKSLEEAGRMAVLFSGGSLPSKDAAEEE